MSEENKNIEEQPTSEDPREPVAEQLPEEMISPEQIIVPETEEQSLNDLNALNDSTDTMETHADHLHKTPGQGWKHYFFEFLMLFLAITLGFFVENQREHYVEHQREKKFARQLLSDLRTDSSLYTRQIKSMRTSLEDHKKFTELMTSNISPTNHDIIKACIPLYYIHAAPSNNVTYTQMKSSGSLRYIQNSGLTDSLQNYYETLRSFVKSMEDMGYDTYKAFVQTYVINHFMMTDIDFFNDSLVNQTPVFLNRTKETEMQLVNIMATYESYIRIHVEKGLVPAAKKVNGIINMLKEEYHLD